jgi:Tetrahydrodipicolinate N-succinyltransferase
MSNQEAHKYLRQNKPGIRNSEITAPPKDYVRPRGFQVVPGLIGRGGKQPGPGTTQTASYYEALQEEMRRYMTHSLIYGQWYFDPYNTSKNIIKSPLALTFYHKQKNRCVLFCIC